MGDRKHRKESGHGAFEKFRLDDLEQDHSLEQKEYKTTLKDLQLRMLKLQLALKQTKYQVVLVFEGPDAAGKGGAIKRVVEKLDPRALRVYSTIKPSIEEYRNHYMRRFWLRLPPHGHLAVFDRSWYGRVLVERVEGFASDEEWHRAYREINEFERLLTDGHAIILKFYIHISKDEQLKRFNKRQADPYKRWKISDEDWRNRKKWEQHNEAAEVMFRKTSTEAAPWHVIAGNFKWHARVETLKTVVKSLESHPARFLDID